MLSLSFSLTDDLGLSMDLAWSGARFITQKQKVTWRSMLSWVVWPALLLIRKLGYAGYMIQEGDCGQFVARELGLRYMDSGKLVHFKFALASLSNEAEGRAEEEQNLAMGAGDSLQIHLGYAVCIWTAQDPMNISVKALGAVPSVQRSLKMSDRSKNERNA
ncbi:hypothetical protein BJY01DRAFT_243993 [Aspergillus pseudoustus]|uniref:Uncharacterized protein n=1 Tax=Aspergillus pseudoustus TaxID=1810923 RepID=A0ABR4KNG6_9EURO